MRGSPQLGQGGPPTMPQPSKANVNYEMMEKQREAEFRKGKFVKHFMIDFMDFTLQKAVNENALFCVQQSGYLDCLDKEFNKRE